jgi:capsular exopolysaccharide synthesis family protein
MYFLSLTVSDEDMVSNSFSQITDHRPASERAAKENLTAQAAVAPDLRDIGRVLVRRRWLILATIAIFTGAAAAVVMVLPPRYSAEAMLMVGDQQPRMLDLQAVVAGTDSELIESEVQILRSRRIARLVIDKLQLLSDPTFAGEAQKKSWWTRATGWIGGPGGNSKSLDRERSGAMAGSAEAVEGAEPEESAKQSRAIDALLKRLDVAARGRSRVVGVSFEASNPKTAAAVANAVVDTYIEDGLDNKLKATVQANRWLASRVDDLRSQVIDTDRLVQQHKAQAGITEGRQVGLVNEQMSGISEQLIQAGAERAQADARLWQAQHSARGSDVSSDVGASPVVQKLRADDAELRRKIAVSNQFMGAKAPEMVQLQAQLAANEAALGAETSKIVAGLANSAAVAHAREDSLKASLARMRQDADRIKSADVSIDAEQQEAQANHGLYDKLLSRAKETSIEAGLQQPDAHVISHADVPIRPSYPNKPVVLALAFAGASMLAALLVFGLENLDQGFRDLGQVEQMLGVPALGFVPQLRPGEQADSYVLTKPFSAYSEAIRGIYTSLILSDVDKPPRVILVTSSLPGEGKSAISIGLARLVARSGKRVLAIDADLRKPRLHNAFGAPLKPGLIDHLAGKATIEEILYRDTESSALVMPSGSHAPNPADIFTSEHMRKLLGTLSAMFDLIILDSAPLLAVSDARSLCPLADKVLFAVRWQHTRMAAALPAIRQIINANGDLAGVLLTMTDTKRLLSYSGDAYYFSQLRKYMQE